MEPCIVETCEIERERERAVSYTHLDVYKRQVWVCVCVYDQIIIIQ